MQQNELKLRMKFGADGFAEGSERMSGSREAR